MPATAALPPSSLRPDEKSLAEYRSVSRLAVAAVGLGLASALVLVSPLLAPVALAAILVSALALRAIAASAGQLVGQWPALAGLSLAVLFLAWGGARHLSRQAQLEAGARQVATAWLRLVQEGRLEEAHQLKLAPQNRLSSPSALKDYYQKNADAARELQAFTSQNGPKALISTGPGAALVYEGVSLAVRDGFSDHVQLKFTLDRPSNQGGPLALWATVIRRQNDETHKAHWEVQSIDTKPAAE